MTALSKEVRAIAGKGDLSERDRALLTAAAAVIEAFPDLPSIEPCSCGEPWCHGIRLKEATKGDEAAAAALGVRSFWVIERPHATGALWLNGRLGLWTADIHDASKYPSKEATDAAIAAKVRDGVRPLGKAVERMFEPYGVAVEQERLAGILEGASVLLADGKRAIDLSGDDQDAIVRLLRGEADGN